MVFKRPGLAEQSSPLELCEVRGGLDLYTAKKLYNTGYSKLHNELRYNIFTMAQNFDPYRPAPGAPSAIVPQKPSQHINTPSPSPVDPRDPMVAPIGTELATPTATPVSPVGADPTIPPPTFWQALSAPWRGLAFLFTHPKSWPYAIVPGVIASTLFSIMGGSCVYFIPRWVDSWIPDSTAWYASIGQIAAQIVLTALGVIFSYVVSMLVTQPLSGPALQALVLYYEEQNGGPRFEDTPFWIDMWRSLRSSLIGAIALPIVVILAIVQFFFPASAIVLTPLSIIISSVFIAWDYLDYPLSVRAWRIRDRIQWVRQHKMLVLGFGLSLWVVLLIPCMQLLLLPIGVIGATRLVKSTLPQGQ